MAQMAKALRAFFLSFGEWYIISTINLSAFECNFPPASILMSATCCRKFDVKKKLYLCRDAESYCERAWKQFGLSSAFQNNTHLNRRKNIFTRQIRFSASDVSLYWQYCDGVTMDWNVPFSCWHSNVDSVIRYAFAIRINCSLSSSP